MLNHPLVQQGKIDFKSIRICFSGAAPLLADTKTRFEALTGARIVEGYSLTEAMMALCVNPAKGPNKLGSVGMPLPDVTVRIFDDDEGTRELPANEVGEIAVCAPQLMIGYWNRPEETAHRAARSRRWTASRAACCTPAISATSTRTATCSSSIARRT